MASGPTGDPNIEDGFSTVDAQPDPSFLVAGMEATARWPAVRQLRAWERGQLAPRPGQSMLDVGCGIGDVAQAWAPALQPDGRVVGIDASEAMLEVARARADEAGLDAEFRVGDALAIDEPDGSFDLVRSERMLQWVTDPVAAISEMVRVLRPGGRLSLIDTDWRTLTFDLPDIEAADAMVAAVISYRGGSAAIGGRLLNLCRDAQLGEIEHTAAAHLWATWDPDTEPAPSGFFPLDAVAGDLVASGHLEPELAQRFVADAVRAGRAGRFAMALTMVGVCGRRTA